jgi:putative transcriptional regulator
MKSDLFAELLAAANDALEHAKGKRDLRSTTLPRLPDPMSADDVRRVRERLQASQAVLARYLNVSTKLVQAWEAEERSPSGPALVLLRLIEQQPGLAQIIGAEKRGTKDDRTKAIVRRKLAAR